MGTGRCTYPLSCQRWQSGCGQCPHQDYPPLSRIDRSRSGWKEKSRAYNRSLLFLTSPASWALRKMEQSIMAPAIVEARVIPNGIDQSVFRPVESPQEKTRLREQFGFLPNDFVLAYVAISTGNPYKDPQTLRRALELLKPAAGQRIVLLRIGAGEDALNSDGSLIERTFAFSEKRAELAALLQACDLYVHSSRAEVAPLALLEAQSCGLPVVATDVGGVRECVHTGESATLVPADEPRALAEAIAVYLQDPEATKRKGEAAEKWAQGRFSRSLMTKRYLEFYDDALRLFQSIRPDAKR
jgi:glycosyltransferase involved in cell wall biosynthesis